MSDRLVRLTLHLVPVPWRSTVLRDLLDERLRLGRSAFWVVRQAARIGLTFRVAGFTELVRDSWISSRRGWHTDLRLAWRSYRRQPGTTVTTVVMLGLGACAPDDDLQKARIRPAKKIRSRP